MDGMLSQEEINALLNGVNNGDDISDMESEPEASTAGTSEFELADSDKDAVGEISNISMGTAATTLSSLLNQKVNITTPKVSVSRWDDLAARYDRPCVMMQISYKEGIDGNNVLILKENDVRIITDLMMGGTGEITSDEPLSELHLSAIGEAMNQMMGSAATSMSSMFSRKIDISPPVANVIETYTDTNENIPEFLKNQFVLVAFRMQIGELIDSEIMQLYPIDFAQELVQMFTSSVDGTLAPQVGDAPASSGASSSVPPTGQQTAQTPPPAPQPQPAPAPQPMPQMQQPMPDMSAQQPMPPYGYPPQAPYGYAQPMYAQPMPPQNVQQASFQPFAGDLSAISQQENIDLIKDVPLEVTVELGRTSKSIKDILEFAPGTIVELNKIAGEPIDILVNGKYVAKGEVVVIEESFGVRITEIMKS
jgi:flagellar motor switch protein FliN/FliY